MAPSAPPWLRLIKADGLIILVRSSLTHILHYASSFVSFESLTMYMNDCHSPYDLSDYASI